MAAAVVKPSALKEDRLEAFQRLMILHEKMVLRTAFRMLGRLEDAQDVSQEVFLRFYRHFEGIREDLGVPAWLYRTTMNLCFDLLRARKPVESIEWDPPVRATQEDDVERDERRRLLAAALQHLPEKERAAVVLREIEGLDTREVAAILGSTEQTVRSQVSVGKSRLRGLMELFAGRTS